MKMTRRKLAAALVAPAVAPAAGSQEQPKQADVLATDRAQLRDLSQALARAAAPITAEPAFQFKA